MEKELAELLTTLLTTNADFTAVMGNKLFPLIADEGTAAPYAVYRVDEDEEISKDGAQRYYVSVGLVFPPKNYLGALELKKKLVPLFLGASNCNFQKMPSPTEYIDDAFIVVATLNFEATDY